MGLQAVRRGAGLVPLLAIIALLGGGCGGPDAKTERLTTKLEGTDLKLYEVSLRDARPVSATVNGDGEIEIRYDRTNGYHGFTLLIRKASYDPQVCTERREEGATCSWRDGIVRSTLGDVSEVALDRDGEHLGLSDLATQSDPELVEDAVKALEKAKVVDRETVASY
jgi:hypothetical protein